MLPGPTGLLIGVKDRETGSWPAAPTGGIPGQTVQIKPDSQSGLTSADD